jgi:hypothetical protein
MPPAFDFVPFGGPGAASGPAPIRAFPSAQDVGATKPVVTYGALGAPETVFGDPVLFGSEQVGNGTGPYTSYVQWSYDGVDSSKTHFYAPIPEGFSGWETDAIRIRLKGVSFPGRPESGCVLWVYSPSTGIIFAFGAGDIPAGGTEYTWITVPGDQAPPNGIAGAFSEGDMLHFELQVASGDTGFLYTYRSGELQINWR